MLNRVFFFSDIDDTLIQTKRKTDFGQNTIVAAYTKEGEESSFFYEGVKLLIDALLKENITFIPTTARNIDSYQRTIFYNEPKIKYAILNFGGTLLVNNEVNEEWNSIMKQAYEKIVPLEEVEKSIREAIEKADLNVVVKNIDSYYISIHNKYNTDNKEYLSNVKSLIEEFLVLNDDFYLYENDNSFGILPHVLNKKFAVDYMINLHKPLLCLGAGDNLSDLAFMNSTSLHLVPNNSSIHKIRLSH